MFIWRVLRSVFVRLWLVICIVIISVFFVRGLLGGGVFIGCGC